MKRLILILGLALVTPGCLAAAVVGGAYVIGKNKEAKATKTAARLDYIQKRRAAGATDAMILEEIRVTDPEWYGEIEKAGGKLPPKGD